MVVVIGMDLSIVSPCASVYDKGVHDVFFFRQTSKTRVPESCEDVPGGPPIRLHELPRIPGPESGDVERYDFIADALLQGIQSRLPSTPCTIRFVVEHYAFSKSSAFAYKLQELTGIVKYVCLKALRLCGHQVSLHTVPSTAWKRNVVAKGNATKQDVLAHVCRRYPEFTGIANQLLGAAGAVVPHPLQDICDAVCIAEHGGSPPAIARKRKRETDD